MRTLDEPLIDCQANSQIFTNSDIHPAYWAKLTTFENGAFELAVTAPPIFGHHKIKEPYRGKFGAILNQFPREKLHKTEQQKQADNLARSVRRSRQSVRHKIKSLAADHLVTLTYRENMTDSDKLKHDFDLFRRMIQARVPDWQYVAVRETQERGALHLHLAVKGRQNLNYLRNCWYVAIGGSISDKGEYTKGAVNVRAPSRFSGRKGKSARWKVDRLAAYLTKYLGKEFGSGTEHHAKRYWHTKTIVKPFLEKFWLTASNFKQAIIESHNRVHFFGATNLSMWASDDWQNIWISGNDLCPF
jgi:hypothetical protein